MRGWLNKLICRSFDRAFKYVRELRDPPPLLQSPRFLNVKLRRKWGVSTNLSGVICCSTAGELSLYLITRLYSDQSYRPLFSGSLCLKDLMPSSFKYYKISLSLNKSYWWFQNQGWNFGIAELSNIMTIHLEVLRLIDTQSATRINISVPCEADIKYQIEVFVKILKQRRFPVWLHLAIKIY